MKEAEGILHKVLDAGPVIYVVLLSLASCIALVLALATACCNIDRIKLLLSTSLLQKYNNLHNFID